MNTSAAKVKMNLCRDELSTGVVVIIIITVWAASMVTFLWIETSNWTEGGGRSIPRALLCPPMIVVPNGCASNNNGKIGLGI